MRISAVTREQFPLWRQMRQAVYSDLEPQFHDEEMEWLFASDQAACFLAWSDDGCAIGLLELTLRNFVDGCIGGPVGYIEGIYLDPHYRGKGHGMALVEFAGEWFRSRGCKHMATDAEIDNIEAQAFYRRLGFAERWHTVGYTRPLGPAQGDPP